MNAWQFILQHHTAIAVVGLWLFSALCSTMPPLNENASYFARWAHDFLQIAAANVYKIGQRIPTQPVGPAQK